MARIISGFAGSLTIAVPTSGTRPTSDRVREAVFSALEARGAIAGCSVLDLYAGSGALGLEAASRGATYVVLVEKSPAAARSCRSNAALIQAKAPRSGGRGVSGRSVSRRGGGTGAASASPLRIEVASEAVQSFLDGDASLWDLVFLDPPYDLGTAELERNLAALAPRLAPDATVVIERSSRSEEPAWPAGLTLDKRKLYGDTAIYWVSPAEP
ncbi:MAG: RsmD family RNA methyltransferase [Microbacteriaceae bacterium]